MQVFKSNIESAFKELVLTKIGSFYLQNFINNFTQSKRFRTAKKIYNLLIHSFHYAVANAILNRNPMAKVVIPKYEIKQSRTITHV